MALAGHAQIQTALLRRMQWWWLRQARLGLLVGSIGLARFFLFF
jgi:hypothetical protein